MKLFASIIVFLVSALNVFAQSAIEHHVWQDARTFQPFSRTASAITGAITLSGNPNFASVGSTMNISFLGRDEIGLVSEGASWREWSLVNPQKRTAEVFRLDRDPGILKFGNTICGDAESGFDVFLVFHEERVLGGLPILAMAAFSSQNPPHDINSIGLCGTYSYEVNEVPEPISAQGDEVLQDVGRWILGTSINPLDDTTTVTLSLLADTRSSMSDNQVTFVARCKSDRTEVIVGWGEYLGDDSSDVYAEWKNVTVRIGEGEAHIERWDVSTDRKATFAPNWAGDFLQDLLGEERLVLQVTPYNEHPNTAIFDITGLRNVLGNLSDTCHWSF